MDKPTFYGVGLGAGSPGNVTRRALGLIRNADRIFCPKSQTADVSQARKKLESIDEFEAELVEYTLSMHSQDERLKAEYEETAKQISQSLEEGLLTLAVTVGDPFLYSTLGPLHSALESLVSSDRIETVTGINSLQAAASRLNRPLAQKDEKLGVIPLTGGNVPAESLFAGFDTLAFTKVSDCYDRLYSRLNTLDLLPSTYLFERLGTPDENIRRMDKLSDDRDPPYFSLVLCFRGRAFP